MRKSLAALAIAITVAAVMSPFDAEAKRLGGAKSAGMQRQNVTAPANTPGAAPGTPGTPAQAAPAAGMAAAAAPAAAAATKRSWMGPLAGLAAGLGIAALASHFGFGEALANMMTIALVVMAVLLLVGFILRKRAQQRTGGMQPAFGGAAPGGAFGSNDGPRFDQQQPMQRSGFDQQDPQRSPLGSSGSLIGSGLAGGAAAAGAVTQPVFPPGFDAAAFERNAKDQFMALQSANDAGDLQRLRDYLTPEMFEVAREEVQQRGAEQQVTQVFGLQAQVLDVTTEADRYVVSVRFTGSIRQQHGAVPDALDEIWHLVKPLQGMGGWLVAGIQQVEAGEGPR